MLLELIVIMLLSTASSLLTIITLSRIIRSRLLHLLRRCLCCILEDLLFQFTDLAIVIIPFREELPRDLQFRFLRERIVTLQPTEISRRKKNPNSSTDTREKRNKGKKKDGWMQRIRCSELTRSTVLAVARDSILHQVSHQSHSIGKEWIGTMCWAKFGRSCADTRNGD